MKNKPEFCVLLRFSEIIFYDGGTLILPSNRKNNCVTYSAEKIKKNKLHFCTLLKFHEISIMSCRRFDLAVKLKKIFVSSFCTEKTMKNKPHFCILSRIFRM